MRNELKLSIISIVASVTQIIMLISTLKVLFVIIYKMMHFGWPIVEFIYQIIFYSSIIFFTIYCLILIYLTIVGFNVLIKKANDNDLKLILIINSSMLIPTSFLFFKTFPLF